MDWSLVSWWIGGVLALVALAAIGVGMRGDPPRGRRRCPKCWYEMSGVAGLKCPECGREQARERRFFRTRRRWARVVLGGGILALGAATAAAPAAFTGEWVKYTPTPVLRGVLSVFSEQAKRVRETARWPSNLGKLSVWERLLIASAIARDLQRDARERWSPWLFDLDVLARLGDEAKPALPELAACLRQDDATRHVVNVYARLGKAARPGVSDLIEVVRGSQGSEARHAAIYILLEIAPDDARVRRALRDVHEQTDDHMLRMDAATALCEAGEIDLDRVFEAVAAAAAQGDADARLRATLCLSGMRQAWTSNERIRIHLAPVHDPGLLTSTQLPKLIADADRTPEMGGRACGPLLACLADRELGAAARIIAADGLLSTSFRACPVPVEMVSLLETEKEIGIRRMILRVLAAGVVENDPRLCAALVEELKAPELSVRIWAASALRRFGPQAVAGVDGLRALAVSFPDLGTEEAVGTLAAIGEPGWAVIEEGLHAAGTVRAGLVRGLGAIAPQNERATARLIAAAKDADDDLRVSAARALSDVEAAAADLARIVREDPLWRVRHSALGALDSCTSGEVVIRACAHALTDADERVRLLAASMFATMSVEGTTPTHLLERLAEDEDQHVRKLARRLLEDKGRK